MSLAILLLVGYVGFSAWYMIEPRGRRPYSITYNSTFYLFVKAAWEIALVVTAVLALTN